MYEKLLRYIVSLNQWRKRHISQNGFLIIAAAMVGALGGLGSSVLKKLTHLVANFLQNDFQHQSRFYLYFFFPVAGLFLTVIYLKLFIRKRNFRSGIPPLIKSITQGRSRLDFHNVYSQIITSALTVGMGGSAGLESPAVSSGAAAGSNLGRLFGLNYRETTLLLACGGAAGISGAFDSPVAGMLFAIEVLLPSFSIPAITPLLISSAVASVVSWMVYNRPLFVYVTDTPLTEGFWIYVVFGIVSGFYSVYYGYMNERIHKRFNKIKNSYSKALVGGLSLGTMITLFPALYGEGYISIQKLLDGDYQSLLINSLFAGYQQTTWFLILFALLSLFAKVIASAVTLSSGGNGGMFGPSVVIGGLMGFIFAFSLNQTGWFDLNVTHFIIAGMAASISGVMHAPLTGIFLAAEITGGYILMVPLMVVSAIAFFINKGIRKYSIYTKDLAEQKNLTGAGNEDERILSRMMLKYLIDRNYVRLHQEDTPVRRREDIIHSDKTVFPVVDEQGSLIGLLNIEQLLEAIYSPDQKSMDTPVQQLVQPLTDFVRADASMQEVLQRMDKKDLSILPVVGLNNIYLGFVTRDAIFSKYRKLLLSRDSLL